jgi:hypothetical protein
MDWGEVPDFAWMDWWMDGLVDWWIDGLVDWWIDGLVD